MIAEAGDRPRRQGEREGHRFDRFEGEILDDPQMVPGGVLASTSVTAPGTRRPERTEGNSR